MIEDYIPYGYSNRISRGSLKEVTGAPDRLIRDSISNAINRGVLIVSADGGYFQPKGEGDRPYVDQYCAQELQRSKTQIIKAKRLKRLREAWEGIPDSRQVPGQMTLDLEGVR